MKNLKKLKELNIWATDIRNVSKIIGNPPLLKTLWLYDTSIANVTEILKTQSKSSEFLERAKRERNRLQNQIDIKSNQLHKYEACKSEVFNSSEIELEIVRKSPRKLVFTIAAIHVKCKECNNIIKITDMSGISNFFEKISNFIENLQKELRIQLNKNKYCVTCNLYYQNLDMCPKHLTPLTYPKLVFIRGINQLYSASRLLKNN